MSNRPRRHSMSDAFRLQHDGMSDPATRHMLNQLRNTLARERAHHERLAAFVDKLPKLGERDLVAVGEADSHCPICLTPFHVILTEEEMALAMDSPAHPVEDLGVTSLVQTCGHIFCRKDIRNWMKEGRKTCPTCRRPFIEPAPEEQVHDDFEAALQQANLFPLRLFDLDVPDIEWMVRESFGMHEGGPGEPQAAYPVPTQPELEPEPEPELEYDDDRSGFAGMYS
ncbi:hypothetical protein B0H21DRAFT_722100 [Amylocystis lapponica]|nr:hypothetical protein B0H21DRAFT_722100 [Amylocystis lapponica]